MGLFGKKKKPPEPEPDNAKPSPITKNGKKFSVIVDSEEVAKINALLNAAKTEGTGGAVRQRRMSQENVSGKKGLNEFQLEELEAQAAKGEEARIINDHITSKVDKMKEANAQAAKQAQLEAARKIAAAKAKAEAEAKEKAEAEARAKAEAEAEEKAHAEQLAKALEEAKRAAEHTGSRNGSPASQRKGSFMRKAGSRNDTPTGLRGGSFMRKRGSFDSGDRDVSESMKRKTTIGTLRRSVTTNLRASFSGQPAKSGHSFKRASVKRQGSVGSFSTALGTAASVSEQGMSAMERGRARAAKAVIRGAARAPVQEIDTRDPEEIAKEAAEKAGGVFLDAEEYVMMVEELDELKKQVETMEAKMQQDAALIDTLQASMRDEKDIFQRSKQTLEEATKSIREASESFTKGGSFGRRRASVKNAIPAEDGGFFGWLGGGGQGNGRRASQMRSVSHE